MNRMLTADLVRERVRGTILERIGGTPLIPLHRIAEGTRAVRLARSMSLAAGERNRRPRMAARRPNSSQRRKMIVKLATNYI